jgi:hypothetical protein
MVRCERLCTPHAAPQGAPILAQDLSKTAPRVCLYILIVENPCMGDARQHPPTHTHTHTHAHTHTHISRTVHK